MPIVIRLDKLLTRKSIRSNELAEKIGLSENNLSRIRTGRIKAIRFSTLEGLCRELNCKPGDILDYIENEKKDE